MGIMSVPTRPGPACLEERHLEYLDVLSQSGTADMYSAAPCLEAESDLSRLEAAEVLVHWFRTFADRHPRTQAPRSRRTCGLFMHQGGAAPLHP